jgi:hypothetical protein
MKKYFLFIALLVITNESTYLNAREVSRAIKRRDGGPVKNIPPPVMQALKAAILEFDPNLNPTLSTSSVTWTREKNLFHVIVFHRCNDEEPLSYTFIADIDANGTIISSRKLDQACIKIPPDQP